MLQADLVATPEYRALLRKRYEAPGWGASGHHQAQTVADFARILNARTILDYGCGRGTLKRKLVEEFGWRLDEVREYDPGIVGKDAMPMSADLVVATDVLEHIEPNLLTNVLEHINRLANRGVYLIIAQGPAKEVLADGRNAHLIQETLPWWTSRLHTAGLRPSRHHVKKGIHVWIAKDEKR